MGQLRLLPLVVGWVKESLPRRPGICAGRCHPAFAAGWAYTFLKTCPLTQNGNILRQM